MFGIGSTELLVILVVALLVLGPRNLPKVAQTLGRAMGEFRKVSTEFQRTLNTEIAFEERAEEAEKKASALKKGAAASGAAANTAPDAMPESESSAGRSTESSDARVSGPEDKA